MYTRIPSKELELRPNGTVKFEGAAYGAQTSFFHAYAEPGRGSGLHTHPYPETWIVRAGHVRFTVGDATIEASAGDIIVAQANIPHKYLNIGTERLEVIGIHPSPQIIQENLSE